MSSDSVNYELIHNIYYDKAGYGSINITRDAARVKDTSISIKGVAYWFDKNMGKKGSQQELIVS